MKKTGSWLSILISSIIILLIVGYVTEEPPHDHKEYPYEHPSSVNLSTSFIVCGDSSLVMKDTGKHLDFIPKYFKEQME